MKKEDLESMTLDGLWSLHEKISTILLTRIQAEKVELEKRLAVLNPMMSAIDDIATPQSSGDKDTSGGKQRRKYPQVLPKYRNPKTSETWSGRGRRPRWLVAEMQLGHSMDEFRIGESGGTH